MKLTQTKDYLLLIDEEAEIKKNDLCLIDRNVGISTGYEILVCEEVEEDGYYHFTDFKTGRCSKIIAYRKLNSEVKELNLPLLPSFEDMNYDELEIKYYQELEEKRLVAINFKGQVAGRHPDNLSSREIHAKVSGFIEGYKAAQSKQFSLEDMRKAVEFTFNAGRRLERKAVSPDFSFEIYREELIQSLSNQKLPKEFITEYINTNSYGSETNGYDSGNFIPKTITNSEGKEEIQGRYVY